MKGEWQGDERHDVFRLHSGGLASRKVSSKRGHHMTREETQKIEERVAAIRVQIDQIAAMLDGTLMTKHNRVRRQDGRVYVSPEHCTFQYRGADGKRRWKRIPRNAQAAVGRLVRAAERYRTLEREYTALLTEMALADGWSKKNA